MDVVAAALDEIIVSLGFAVGVVVVGLVAYEGWRAIRGLGP